MKNLLIQIGNVIAACLGMLPVCLYFQTRNWFFYSSLYMGFLYVAYASAQGSGRKDMVAFIVASAMANTAAVASGRICGLRR